MKEYYRKHIFGIFFLCMLVPILTGCSISNNKGIMLEYDPAEEYVSDKTIVTFFGYKADALNLTAIEKAISGFMENNSDIYVTYEGLKGMEYWNAFKLRYKTGNLDDIIMIDHDTILSLVEEGQLADLSGLTTLDNYIPWTKGQFTNADGSVYFLPTCVSTYNLYINTDLLEKYGLSVPSNLEEFTYVCDFFTEKGITPVIANNYASIPSLIVSVGMSEIYAMENSYEEICKFNSGEKNLADQVRSGIEFVENMMKRGWLDGEEVINTSQTSDDLAIFAEGNRPFMISGGWASVRLDVDFNYGVYPYPVLEDGCVMAMSVDTCIGINSQSDNVQEALKLLEYFTQPDIMWDYCDSQCSYSPLTDSRTPTDKTIAPSAPYLTNGRIVLRSDYNLDFPLESALRECSNQMLTGMDADSAMELLSELLYPQSKGDNAS